jgi:hypothetical protein
VDRYTEELLFWYELAETGRRVATGVGAGVVASVDAAWGGTVEAGVADGVGGEVHAVRRDTKTMRKQYLKRIVRFPTAAELFVQRLGVVNPNLVYARPDFDILRHIPTLVGKAAFSSFSSRPCSHFTRRNRYELATFV